MIIDEKLLHDDLYAVILDQVRLDFHHGLFNEQLITLSNLASSLESEHLSEAELLDLWVEYLVYCQIQKLYVKQPELFHGFKQIIGERHIAEIAAEGGIFLSFQYGHFMAVPPALEEILQNTNHLLTQMTAESAILKLKESSSQMGHYHLLEGFGNGKVEESSSWQSNWSNSNNESFYYFLDESSSLEQSADMQVDFFSGKIKAQADIFRLAVNCQKPVSLVLSCIDKAGEPIIRIFEPVHVNAANVEEVAQRIYRLFEEEVIRKPQYWKNWSQHSQLFKVKSNKIANPVPSIDILNRWGTYGLNIQSGEIYQIGGGS
ncbi:hypothetical protein SAMN05421736_101250 [Evansella caseinilytica]|uniref:Uncharacterized protein n=1 Tax=Evansella caseinilytica TaxID=1503961 RepID=A0A1H3GT74_9BACI|nr:hypothetical protein [Evansella caseinilytica]SDY05539.1 hypothetical protein SAMN05421736_101250 [Evansella caseinilytica]